MASEGQEMNKAKFYAGLYLRTKNRTKFWGWGDPPAQAAERSIERPWAQLGDWLRMAHSFTKQDLLAQCDKPTPVLSEEKGRTARSARRGLRFVCNKSFVGLVIR
jgi:hypothetical protein